MLHQILYSQVFERGNEWAFVLSVPLTLLQNKTLAVTMLGQKVEGDVRFLGCVRRP